MAVERATACSPVCLAPQPRNLLPDATPHCRVPRMTSKCDFFLLELLDAIGDTEGQKYESTCIAKAVFINSLRSAARTRGLSCE